MAHTGEQDVKGNLAKAFAESKDGFISGQQLADVIGCSRTAVWKHIDKLRKEGYTIEAVKKKGYRIVGKPDHLSETGLLMGLETANFGRVLAVYDVVESTQTIAKELAVKGTKSGTVVIAEQQTAGKGRLNRHWHSPAKGGIWLSLIVKPDIEPYKASQLTLLTAVAVVEALAEIGVESGIKWPNDVLVNGKKITGILTELNAEADVIHFVIIGIGLNVNQTMDQYPEDIRNIATSVYQELQQKVSRTKLTQILLKILEDLYEQFLNEGFSPIKEKWEQNSITIGQRITVKGSHETITGFAAGINENGVLILRTDDGAERLIYSGDVTIKK